MPLCTFDKFKSICLSIPIDSTTAESKIKIPAFSPPVDDGSMGGFGAVLLALVKEQRKDLLGSCGEMEAVVRQWIEYSVCKVNVMDSCGITHDVLKDINSSMAAQAYLAGNSKTLADIVLYHLLYECMRSLSLQEKEKYIHLSRWYNNLQQDVKLRGSHPTLTFSRTLLY